MWITWDADGSCYAWREQPYFSESNQGWLASKPDSTDTSCSLIIFDKANYGAKAIQTFEIELKDYLGFESTQYNEEDFDEEGVL